MCPSIPAATRIFAVCVPLLVSVHAAAGDADSSAVLTDQQIEQALHPPRTRSFTPAGSDRGLVRHEQLAQSVSLNIQFEHNSSALKAAASVQLHQLQLALTSPSLRADRFVVAGHTDAQGNARYNKRLSLRRAETVKRFLVSSGVDARRIDTVGYGSERLLAPDHPYDARNRRVEIRDLGAAAP